MTDTIFQVDQLREDIDLEAKRASGRDGKGALPADVWETYSALANTDGGQILLGVSEQDGEFEATGIENIERVLNDFWNQINNQQKVSRNLLSHNSVKILSIGNGRSVIIIEVPRASRKERPIFIKGNPLTGTFKRQQSGDFRCTDEEVRRMLAEQTEDERDARILKGYSFDDIGVDSFKDYRNRLAALKPDHPYNGVENLDFLKKLGGWRKDRETGSEGLTLAGLLMFGKHESIHEAVPNYFVDYRELPVSGSQTEWVDRLTPDGTWSGNLYDFYRRVIQRLFRDLKVPFHLESTEREDETPVHKALREALVNAIVHADYSGSMSILVAKASDYFGFRNPGRMRIPIEKALGGGHSDCRNRSLQRMFSLIGLGEQAGSGIPRVLENWKARHYRVPELWESLEPEATLMRLRTVSLLPKETLLYLRNRFGDAFERLDENGRLAVATAQIEGFVTNGRMQQLCRLHPRDLTILLKKLGDDGFLLHDGQGRGTTYRIAGIQATDLADSVDLANPMANSAHLETSSAHLETSSAHLETSSAHLETSSAHLASAPLTDARLQTIALPVALTSKAPPELIESTIIELCRGNFLTLNQIAQLLGRSASGLRQRFIKPMVDESKVLERRFPQQPNHEQQAYRTRDS
jgi:ATP-dependent DNA helicase RecG